VTNEKQDQAYELSNHGSNARIRTWIWSDAFLFTPKWFYL
jgi:hypothetical protein